MFESFNGAQKTGQSEPQNLGKSIESQSCSRYLIIFRKKRKQSLIHEKLADTVELQEI